MKEVLDYCVEVSVSRQARKCLNLEIRNAGCHVGMMAVWEFFPDVSSSYFNSLRVPYLFNTVTVPRQFLLFILICSS